MKKHMTRNIILMLVLDVILGIVLALYISSTGTLPAADNADTYTDADAEPGQHENRCDAGKCQYEHCAAG